MTPEERADAMMSWLMGDPEYRAKPDVLREALVEALTLQVADERERCRLHAARHYEDPAWMPEYRHAGEAIARAIASGKPPPPPRKP